MERANTVAANRKLLQNEVFYIYGGTFKLGKSFNDLYATTGMCLSVIRHNQLPFKNNRLFRSKN